MSPNPSREDPRHKKDGNALGAKALHSSRAVSRQRKDDSPQGKKTRVNRSNPQPNKSGNPSIRSHDPVRKDLQVANEIHMFETTIRSINTAHSDIVGEIYCLEALFEPHNVDSILDPMFAFKASSYPDTLCHHQAMRQPDREDFKVAMSKEIQDQMKNGNFKVLRRNKLPEGTQILPTVWQMKRKIDIQSGKILKCKARLNVDGSKMKKGMHYDETCAPVANWSSVRLLLTLVTAMNWHSVQIDYVQAFPQAHVEKPMYLKIPIGFQMSKGDLKE